jgi:hypothetical protein
LLFAATAKGSRGRYGWSYEKPAFCLADHRPEIAGGRAANSLVKLPDGKSDRSRLSQLLDGDDNVLTVLAYVALRAAVI